MHSYELTRLQFPLRLAYCLTMNKSQGQTIRNRMLLDLTNQSFAHGHLYVALSRITSFYNIMIFCNQDQIYNEGAIANSIVYRDLFKSFPNGM